ncbi:aminotransferase class V-fold PLP-dependent enzyme [Sporosarcina siberiensis]|uniref:Aminotransferase class V-fold PLP-dependent enzyme n=1 Tax=Sporosarcina siberiensis TaxID=1365606 RepID=A0ABW4SKQ9_9BACL
MNFIYKIAETYTEYEQIHKLNYKTFAEEIPQHERNETHMLVDKFHHENTYIICIFDGRVIGMIAIRSKRPFSLDGKIGEVEQHLPFRVKNPVEIRLLAIEQKYRNGRAFLGIAQALIRYCLRMGYDAALISGTMREQKLYGQLGFSPFGKLTGTKDAEFQPMYLTKETFELAVAGRLSKPHINFLPGPATISEDVQKAMLIQPFSHRSTEFENVLTYVQKGLTNLTKAKYVQLLQGTGTLANDVVAAQLSLKDGKGLILANGEFGFRLVDHAERFGMEYDILETTWGQPFKNEEIIDQLKMGHYSWLWVVHSETSTGILNELSMLQSICSTNNVLLAVDCVSSIGTVPLDLKGVAFASGVSGKGFCSYTGVSFVFHNEPIPKSKRLPRYLDLGTYAEAEGIPFSQSSNLVSSLAAALQEYEDPNKVFASIQERSSIIRRAVEKMGFTILAQEEFATPAILTLVIPKEFSSKRLGDNLFLNGFNVHYESTYLCERNWLQISCMNNVSNQNLDKLIHLLSVLN